MDAEFDFEKYAQNLQLVGSLSRLFSTSDTPFIQYRTAEILFSHLAGGQNIASEDNSFDAITANGTPVGVKTFVASSTAKHKKEKIAEFSQENIDLIRNLDFESAVKEIARWRNLRVLSDAKQKGLDLNKAIYHCLIRRPGEIFIHEEPYPLIKEDEIFPLTSSGSKADKFTGLHFSDGENSYTFLKSKSTLTKKFEFSKGFNSKSIPIEILEDPISALQGLLKKGTRIWTPEPINEEGESSNLIAGKDYVVLPLYSSTKKHGKKVYESSGINQWNANGRTRKYKEAYIPVPVQVRNNERTEKFFPSRDTRFHLTLPNKVILSVKICQAGGKALMSDPNTALGDYLFSVIDAGGYHEKSWKVFTYRDLLEIGKDSVIIYKDDPLNYRLEFSNIGSYEEFLDGVSL